MSSEARERVPRVPTAPSTGCVETRRAAEAQARSPSPGRGAPSSHSPEAGARLAPSAPAAPAAGKASRSHAAGRLHLVCVFVCSGLVFSLSQLIHSLLHSANVHPAPAGPQGHATHKGHTGRRQSRCPRKICKIVRVMDGFPHFHPPGPRKSRLGHVLTPWGH